MPKRIIIVLLFILAIFLVVATTYKEVEVFNKSELNNLSCGWPLQYVSSSFEVSRKDPPYPWRASCAGLINGEWGDPVDIRWGYFIFDVAFFYLLILASYYSSNIIVKKMLKRKQGHSNAL